MNLKVADHVEQEQECPVVDARQLAGVAVKAGSPLKFLLLGLPVHAEGRIGEQVVEVLTGELVVGKRVAELDLAVLVTLDEQVGGGDGEGAVVVVLAVNLDR